MLITVVVSLKLELFLKVPVHGCGDAEGDAGKKLLTPSVRRLAVSWAIQEKGYTQRRACRLVGLEPKTYRYATRRPDDAVLRQRLKDLASERRRSAIGAYTSCCAGRASCSTARSSTGSIARKD